METVIIMQTPTQTAEYCFAFLFVMINITIAGGASALTLMELCLDWKSVKWNDVAFLLSGLTLVLVGKYGPPSFVGTFDLTTAVVTWAVANTIYLIYRGLKTMND
ncbi:MAG: hypothetical protein HY226_06860 [Candidatus Vogelbacteria bacterium]|nr:hypothetical protein [Candidatus Vogelbacteria bacterium]